MLGRLISQSASDTSILAVEIALVIFFLVFVGIGVYTFFILKKDKINYMANLPLDEEIAEKEEKSSNNVEELSEKA